MTVAEGSGDTRLPLTRRGVARLPPRLRETYLDPEVKDGSCITQTSGTEVRIWIWSSRDNVRLSIPRTDFSVRRPYEQSIHRWGVNLSRYLDGLLVDDSEEQAYVDAAVDTFEGAMPDV